MSIGTTMINTVFTPLAASPTTQPLVPGAQASYGKAKRQAAIGMWIWWVLMVPLITAVAILLPFRHDMASLGEALSEWFTIGFIIRGAFTLVGLVIMIVAAVRSRTFFLRWRMQKWLGQQTTPANTATVAPIRAAIAPQPAEVAFTASSILLPAGLLIGGLLWAAGFFLAAQWALMMFSTSAKAL